MTEQHLLLALYIVGLTVINVAAYRYVGLFGLFVSAASVPIALRILDKLSF